MLYRGLSGNFVHLPSFFMFEREKQSSIQELQKVPTLMGPFSESHFGFPFYLSTSLVFSEIYFQNPFVFVVFKYSLGSFFILLIPLVILFFGKRIFDWDLALCWRHFDLSGSEGS
ncbi:unnamed protein product [Lepeophtheirus salmonis]|uniref:(salmon louse) hypothetical protein n=1 Tax=Lepeophtheirus salmonis TaxID=72036 RepID=A0A7R8CQH1_LEPSM|nr:unnamed protein product [Lepeophtheirus salmonis]CAF2859312.1 unnamed protein product [Lepeophtheirus salmonis]